MNFSGFVPVRRGILDHTMAGNLTLQEFAALMTLIMLADKSTGAGKINGPVLRTFLPGLSPDAAKRVLHSLDEKGYIFRNITPRSPLLYPFWINHYQPTVGPYKSLQTDVSKARITKAPSDVRYIASAPESALDTSPEGAPDSALEGAHYNKKEKEKNNNKDTPFCTRSSERDGDAKSETGGDSRSERNSEQGGERKVSSGDSMDAPDVEIDPLLSGLEYRDGEYFTQYGTKVHPSIFGILQSAGKALK